MAFRKEQDSMGTVTVPEDAYYGAQTQRAVENFTISGLTFSRSFIKALGLIKKHAARVNRDLGLLDKTLADSIITAAQEVAHGNHDNQFVLDIFQTGSGTSTHMNANEVIAGRANEILTGVRGGKEPVHPNDHVNICQSSNDVIPSALHISTLTRIRERLIPAAGKLQRSLQSKAAEFMDVAKIGRTHLQDAIPITLGQEFSGYARQIELAVERLESVEKRLGEITLGGTAVGTGSNTHPEFATKVIEGIAEETGCPFTKTANHFEAQAGRDAIVEVSGVLKTIAVGLTKIANDMRWLSSGPRCGVGEINLPSLQPGSSFMPGKVNPVIPEAVLQVAAQVIGNDATITLAGQAGNFDLNAMLPVIAYNVLQSIDLLASSADALAEKCIEGITANVETCRANVEKSLALSTALAPAIGYDRAADVAKKAYEQGKTVRQTALEMKVLPEQQINSLIDSMINGDKTI